ncbi:MAG TPA: alpha/beta hydrolase [Acidimicrobiales bacterium]|nr:alpha/beta hydrolase [Acidimicrobiales bacterium]
MEITEGRVHAGELEFGFLEIGSGPLALCLHGFPDSAWGWRHLLPRLADAGFRAVAPFMRGYAPTEVPADGLYQTGALASDACALHEALGGDGDAVLIGHDWGAVATYGAASLNPGRWRRVIAAAVPPAGAMGQGFLDYDQLRRSWYMFFFQHPLADIVVPMDDLAFIDRLWADWSPGYDATDDVPHVKDALRDPANLAAALGYYRATLGDGPKHERYEIAQQATQAAPPQPTLYLHGLIDGCIGAELASGAESSLTAPGSRVVMVEGAGHFLHLEQPEIVNPIIVDFARG